MSTSHPKLTEAQVRIMEDAQAAWCKRPQACVTVGGRNMVAVDNLEKLGLVSVVWTIDGRGTQSTRWRGEVTCTTKGAIFHIWPTRKRTESPIAYYKRTKHVDDRFQDKFQGRYYCNPAHCSRTWTDKAARDEHITLAYAALG